jgi:hypothetical protein
VKIFDEKKFVGDERYSEKEKELVASQLKQLGLNTAISNNTLSLTPDKIRFFLFSFLFLFLFFFFCECRLKRFDYVYFFSFF